MKITNQTEFMHVRDIYNSFGFSGNDYVVIKTRAHALTFAYIVSDTKITVGVAHKSYDDNFSKQKGREVAQEKLLAHDSNTVGLASFELSTDEINTYLRKFSIFDRSISDLSANFAFSFSDLTPYTVRQIILMAFNLHADRVKDKTKKVVVDAPVQDS